MRFPSIDSVIDSFYTASRRFPLALLCSLLSWVLMANLIANGNEWNETILLKIISTVATGVPFLIGLHLVAEQKNHNQQLKWGLYIGGVLVLVLYYLLIAPDFNARFMVQPIRAISILMLAHLFVSTAPFVFGGEIEDLWEYNKEIFSIWLAGALYGFVIAVGLWIAILAVDQLFVAHIDFDWYSQIFVWVAAFFHPIYFMSNFPKQFHQQESKENFTKTILNLVKYILIPLSLLYMAILYMYGLKIISEWSLPRGWVSGLVIGFSVTGILTYLLNYKLPQTDQGSILAWFKKWFFYILSPLIVLLYVAVFKRIGDYGCTPPRYFILITGVWLSCISIYFIISRTDNIKWIPVSLGIFLLVGTYSPIDAFHFSIKSQTNILNKVLESNHLIKDSQFQKASSDKITAETKDQISSVLYSLENLNALDQFRNDFPKDSLQSPLKASDILSYMQLNSGNIIDAYQDIINYYADSYLPNDIKGFSKIVRVDLYKNDKKETGTQLDTDNKTVIWKQNGIILEKISFENEIKQLLLKYPKTESQMSPENLSFTFETDKYKMKFCLNSLGIQKIANQNLLNNMDGYLLYSEK